MKTANMVKYISILGFILILFCALLQTGGNGTSITVVLITSFIFIAASIKSKNFQKK